MKPKISVIVPMYNVYNYIDRCIDSILRQDYDNYEIIIINDGSTDGSRDRIKKYEKLDTIRIIDKPNGGLSSARNVGLDNAIGDYILFVDSDDYIEPQTLSNTYSMISNSKSDMCCFRISYFSNNNNFIGGKDFEYSVLNGKENILKDALINKNIKSSACVKLYDAKIIRKNKIRFIPNIINEDYPFLIACAQHMSRVCFINKPFYYAYQRDNSISRSFKSINVISFIDLYKTIWINNPILETLNLKCYYDAGFVKNELYTMVQAAYRSESYSRFKQHYNLLKESPFFEFLKNRNTIHLDKRGRILSRLILYPFLFYSLIKILRMVKLKIA